MRILNPLTCSSDANLANIYTGYSASWNARPTNRLRRALWLDIDAITAAGRIRLPPVPHGANGTSAVLHGPEAICRVPVIKANIHLEIAADQPTLPIDDSRPFQHGHLRK